MKSSSADTPIQVFGPPPANHATTGLPQHGFGRISKWEYLGKSSSESSATPSNTGDASVKLDFGLSNTMLENIPSEWKKYQFGITYSVTLNKEDLETSLAIRNTGPTDWEFHTLFHTYLAVDVSFHAYRHIWEGIGTIRRSTLLMNNCCTEHLASLDQRT